MASNYKGLPDHVGAHGKEISQIMEAKFGISMDDVKSALDFDPNAIAKIADAGIKGQDAQFLMPLITEAATQCIGGVVTYNQGMAKILKQAGSGAVKVDKAANDTSITQLQFKNNYTELAQQLKFQLENERTRHNGVMNAQQLGHYVQKVITMVNTQASLQAMVDKPAQLQAEENYNHEREVIKDKFLTGGRNEEFIQHRVYQNPETEYVRANWSLTNIIDNAGRMMKAAIFGS